MKKILFAFTMFILAENAKAQVFFTTGFRMGELTDSSVIMQTRLCGQAKANPINHERKDAPMRHPIGFDNDMPIGEMDGAVLGKKGKVRFNITSTTESFRSRWIKVSEQEDYQAKISFQRLKAGTEYKVRIEGKSGLFAKNETNGSFKTPVLSKEESELIFTVSSCQYFWDFDDQIRGFKAYDAINSMSPAFHCQTGDYVYYDKPGPLAFNKAQAKHKWTAMNAWPSLAEFYNKTPLYIQKDDHDILDDDSNPFSNPYGDLTFREGIDIWYEQNPVERSNPFRTFRWGKDLQLWFVEGREVRSNNKDEDSDSKTILGEAQKTWLAETMEASDATFKLFISATPVVGPDRVSGKNDNHSNKAFSTEGHWLRDFLSKQENAYVICGDRHWQYVSQDIETGLMEFSSGATSDEHAQGWNQEDYLPQHQFLRVKGGFLAVKIKGGNQITFEHYDVNGNSVNKVVKLLP
jgi:alkaline phosphatase D